MYEKKRPVPPAAGRGRTKGVPNKITTSIKTAFVEAFIHLGGVPALVRWGQENPTDFYKLVARLIPVEVQAKIEHTQAAGMTDDELAIIAARGSGRVIAAQESPQEPDSVH